MLADFKKFLMRGNVLDLAVAVIIGAAFGAVVKAFTDGIVMQIVAAIVGEPSFDDVVIDIGDAALQIGTFFTALLNFVIIGAVLFAIIKSYENLQARRASGEVEEEPAPDPQIELLTEIRDALRSRT